MTQQKSPSASMIQTLTGIATISGVLIVLAFQITLPAIQKNKARILRQSIFEVLPGIEQMITYKLNTNGELVVLQEEDPKAIKLYAGYDHNGQLLGIAAEAQGQGFQDVIKVIYGYSPEKEAIIGLKVLESKETPGLGDKIYKDPDFRANFNELSVRLSNNKDSLEHPLEIVKKGKKTQKWQIDAITGATISSKAIGKLLNNSTQVKIPLMVKNLEILKTHSKGNSP